MSKTDQYIGFYVSDNILCFPNQTAITKLSFPRLFIRWENSSDAYFSSYEKWKKSLIVIEWLDPADKPTSDREVDRILTDCWNFLALHEEEEERLFQERYEDDF